MLGHAGWRPFCFVSGHDFSRAILSKKKWALPPVFLCLIGTWPLGFAAVFAVYRG